MSDTPQGPFLRFPELKAKKHVPFTRQHLQRLENQGKFPKRVRLGENTVAWSEPAIDEWLRTRECGPRNGSQPRPQE